MSERIDDVARTVAERPTRRGVLSSLGALALGSLGILGVRQGTAAKNNKCQQCKNTCRRNNKKRGKKNKNNCGNKCRNKCRNNR
jgi:hypothetical protein